VDVPLLAYLRQDLSTRGVLLSDLGAAGNGPAARAFPILPNACAARPRTASSPSCSVTTSGSTTGEPMRTSASIAAHHACWSFNMVTNNFIVLTSLISPSASAAARCTLSYSSRSAASNDITAQASRNCPSFAAARARQRGFRERSRRGVHHDMRYFFAFTIRFTVRSLKDMSSFMHTCPNSTCPTRSDKHESSQ
jgi:hypothetical protein